MEDIHGAGNAGPFNQLVSLPFIWLLLCFLFILCSICVFFFLSDFCTISTIGQSVFLRHYEDDNYKRINIRF